MLTCLDHVVIAVRDLDAAAATCGSLLGRRPSWCGTHPELGTRNALFRLGNAYVELLAPGSGGPLSDDLAEQLARAGDGLAAIAFGTDDAAACARTLRERGVPAPDPLEGRGVASGSAAERRWRVLPLPGAATRGAGILAVEHRSPADALPAAEPVGDAQAAVAAIDHVVVATGDPEAAKRLYGETLGLRLALDRRFDAWGVRLLFFRVGGVTVELAARLDGEGEPPERDRLWGISYRTPDVAAARERLAAAGFDVSEVRAGRRPDTRVCTVRGEPLGVATLLLGPDPS